MRQKRFPRAAPAPADAPLLEPIAGVQAKIHPVKGGGRILAYSLDGSRIKIEFPEKGKDITLTIGELEALSLIYSRLKNE